MNIVSLEQFYFYKKQTSLKDLEKSLAVEALKVKKFLSKHSISTEGFKDWWKKSVQKVKDFFAKVWAWMKDMGRKIKNFVLNIFQKSKNVQDKMKNLKDGEIIEILKKVDEEGKEKLQSPFSNADEAIDMMKKADEYLNRNFSINSLKSMFGVIQKTLIEAGRGNLDTTEYENNKDLSSLKEMMKEYTNRFGYLKTGNFVNGANQKGGFDNSDRLSYAKFFSPSSIRIIGSSEFQNIVKKEQEEMKMIHDAENQIDNMITSLDKFDNDSGEEEAKRITDFANNKMRELLNLGVAIQELYTHRGRIVTCVNNLVSRVERIFSDKNSKNEKDK